MKEGLLAWRKGHLCLSKGHLDNPEGQMQIESPLIRKYFLYILFKLKKEIFFKKGTFNKASNPDALSF